MTRLDWIMEPIDQLARVAGETPLSLVEQSRAKSIVRKEIKRRLRVCLYSKSDLTANDRGFVEGTAHAVAILLRAGEDTKAEEIWDTLGGLGTKVPKYVDQHDAKPIRAAIRKEWGRK